MKIIKEYAENELIIEKSRFISQAFQVNSLEEATSIINTVKKKYWDANHNCQAFIIGENQEYMRSSDDGEPSGTAGVPILETLKKNNITNTLVIVTRYFGGIKLGAGGLVRAYSKATSLVLSNASFIRKKELSQYRIVLDYSDSFKCLDYIKENTHYLSSSYSEAVTIVFATESIDSIIQDIQNIINKELHPEFEQKLIIDIQA